MTLKWFNRIIGFALITVAGMFADGCATQYKAYSGPKLPNEQVGILKLSNGILQQCDLDQVGGGSRSVPFNICVMDCDGVKRDGEKHLSWADEIAVLPGKHSFTFDAYIRISNDKLGSCTTECNIEAGAMYLATGMMIKPAQVTYDALGRGVVTPGTLSVTIVRRK
jgi:hypothetical protein